MIAKEENEEKKKGRKKTTTKKELCRLHSFFPKGNTSGVVMEDCSLCYVDFFSMLFRVYNSFFISPVMMNVTGKICINAHKKEQQKRKRKNINLYK